MSLGRKRATLSHSRARICHAHYCYDCMGVSMGFKVGMPVGLQLCQGLGRVWQNDRLSMWLKMSDIDIYIYIFF